MALLFAIAMVGCTNTEPDTEALPTADALTGTAQTIDGQTIDLAAYQNSDLVVWFWAPW